MKMNLNDHFFLAYLFDSMRSALCAMRSALCALRSALCALRSALCDYLFTYLFNLEKILSGKGTCLALQFVNIRQNLRYCLVKVWRNILPYVHQGVEILSQFLVLHNGNLMFIRQ